MTLACQIGHRLRALRLAKGWTQEELAQRSGLAVSTLKLIEAKGQGSFHRLIRVAIALNVDAEIRTLFESSSAAESIEVVQRAERQRAPRRQRKGSTDGN